VRAVKRPNLLVILIDDLRFDEFGAGGHPYMKTPNIDRIAAEGALCSRAFHTTPLCSPNRASIVTGQYASRHGIIDNVARDAHSHRLPNYHLALQKLGYETAHVGKWHMGNEGGPRPGYDHWVSFDGHGNLFNPRLNENGVYTTYEGYITDLLNQRAVEFVSRKRDKPFSLFFAHKAVHPDAVQAADGKLTLDPGNGYKPAPRHEGLYEGAMFPPRPNVIPMSEVVKDKPVWREAFEIKATETSQALLESVKSGDQEEMRLRARMMASVDEGVGQLFDALEKSGQLDDTFILFLGDNGYFFGEHGLGLERRFAYEEGIRSPFTFRYPRRVKPGTKIDDLVLALDIAPTCIELAGGTPGAQVQGLSLLPLMEGSPEVGVPGGRPGWRSSIMCEYFSENAMPWLIGMSYKAVRTDRYKLVHWVNRGDDGELDELYDLERDPYEMKNLIDDPACAEIRRELRAELARLVAASVGL
jgi:N-acetylglucosamine-6-sulfatase